MSSQTRSPARKHSVSGCHVIGPRVVLGYEFVVALCRALVLELCLRVGVMSCVDVIVILCLRYVNANKKCVGYIVISIMITQTLRTGNANRCRVE